MKKITLISVLLLAFLATGIAQNQKFFRFGIMGSPNIAWMKPESKHLETKGLRLTFGYGLAAEFTLADNYSLATGIESAYNGGGLQWVDTLKSTTATYKLQYLEIPLTLKMKTNEINYITYFARFGGGLNMRLRSDADFEYKDLAGNPLDSPSDVDIKSDINLFRISFIIGLGIEYSLGGTTSILVGVNFNNGLTDVFKDKDMNAKNNYISVNMGILF